MRLTHLTATERWLIAFVWQLRGVLSALMISTVLRSRIFARQ